MLKMTQFENERQNDRLKAKTLDSMFRRRVENGANCSPFVSEAILKQAKAMLRCCCASHSKDRQKNADQTL